MAIFDVMYQLMDNKAVTASAASEDILDLVVEDVNLGAGTPLFLNVKVGDEDFDSGADDGTLTIAFCYDTVAPIDGSSIVEFQTAAIAEATMTAGTWLVRQSLPINLDPESIVGLYFTVAGSGNFTAGKIDAWISTESMSDFNTQVATSNI